MEVKGLRLEFEASPRAVDELKAIFSDMKCSKYELPLLLIPESREFISDISIVDELVWINIICRDISVLLKGKLDGKTFSCRSVSRGSVTNGKRIAVSFVHKAGGKLFHISPELKKRLDMWYEYIDILMKKARENIYFFRFEEVTGECGGLFFIHVSGYDEIGEIKNLSIGAVDNSNEPSYSFGKVERFEKGTLYVRTDRLPGSLVSGQTKLAVFDAAALITCKRMKTGLDKLCRGEAVNKRLTEFLFDPSRANMERGDNISLQPEDLLMKNMNIEQLSAVEGALNAEDLYLIQGPPGTGKTTVIAEICYQNAVRGLKTLVVSQSNLAVDNAISRVMNHNDVRVLRKGDSSRVEDEGLPFVEDNVVRTWIGCVSESAGKMALDLNNRLNKLKKEKSRLPDVLNAAEEAAANYKIRNDLETQAFFYKNVLEEADSKRDVFLELVGAAYEKEDIEDAFAARKFYPSDFRVPNNIYNEISLKFADIESDVKKIRELEDELEFFSEYTSKFTRQFAFIEKHTSKRRMENTAYEGVFYYADRDITINLYREGERIIKSIPFGMKSLFFRPKWGKVAAIYYRRAENLMMSIQLKTIKLADRIYSIKNNEEYRFNTDAFRLSLDALCEDFDSQYFSVKIKYNDVLKELRGAIREHEYSVNLFSEQISDKFYANALDGVCAENPPLDEIENSVNLYYANLASRYIKWQKLLSEWRDRINGEGVSYSALKHLYIDNANVIGITCIQSGTADFENNYPSFDVVIIDESSKSTPPDIILPMLKGKKIVLVGDHKQLPPYIDSKAYDETGAEDSDDRIHSLMKISLFEELYESAPDGMKTMLFRQYRMHRDIAGLINRFYINTDAGRLESPSVEPKDHGCQCNDIGTDNHVIWYITENREDYFEARRNKSYYNIYEAEYIKRILFMINQNLLQSGNRRSVGVITFYDAQVKLLEDKLIGSGFFGGLSNIDLRIGSVDRFQGMEEDIVIISFVRNNNLHNIGFAKDCRRINVALSRAKQLLVIVGCPENFTGSKDEEAREMFTDIYSHVKKLNGIRNPANLPEASVTARYDKEYRETADFQASVFGDEPAEESADGINILDYFILKAAYEFKGNRLTVGNISNVLCIAQIFVKSRISFLVAQGYISCVRGVVNILDEGEKAVQSLNNSFS